MSPTMAAGIALAGFSLGVLTYHLALPWLLSLRSHRARMLLVFRIRRHALRRAGWSAKPRGRHLPAVEQHHVSDHATRLEPHSAPRHGKVGR